MTAPSIILCLHAAVLFPLHLHGEYQSCGPCIDHQLIPDHNIWSAIARDLVLERVLRDIPQVGCQFHIDLRHAWSRLSGHDPHNEARAAHLCGDTLGPQFACTQAARQQIPTD